MRKSIQSSALFLIFVLLCSPCLAKESKRSSKEQTSALHSGIEKILREEASDVHVGIEVVSMTTGKRLYQKIPQHLFVPASCLKMITGAAALHELGVDYRFETKMFTDGKIEQKTLKGNLFLQGSGDPELAFRDLEELVFQLKLNNIQKIEGDLYVDNTLFDGVSQGPGWMWDEGANRWNSPMDALTLNHSCVDVWVKPAEHYGKAPLVYVHPKTDFIVLENRAVTTEEEDNLSVERRWMQRENVIEVKGQVSSAKEALHFMIPVEDPHLYTGHVFRDILIKAGFAFKGKIAVKATPQGALLLATHVSRSLSLLVEEMMKSSDNLYADCLFKKIGEKKYGAPGTWQKGSQAVREFLAATVGMNVEKMVVLDGSGLSRYNLISARQFVEFLTWMHSQFNCCSEFVSALPISGVDGTLIDRMGRAGMKGKVRAKTGSMTGISSLSGYLTTNDGETLAFSILQNGFTGKASEYKTKIEDEICGFLVNYSGAP